MLRLPADTPAMLTDAALIVRLRDAIAEAQRRPRLKAELRRLLADALGEEKAEALSGSALSADEIAAVSSAATLGLAG